MLSEHDRRALVEIEHHLIGDEQLVRVFASLIGAPGKTRRGWIVVVRPARWAAAIIVLGAIPPLWWMALTIAPMVSFVVVPLTATLLAVALVAHPPPRPRWPRRL